jgi:hypothetical protein
MTKGSDADLARPLVAIALAARPAPIEAGGPAKGVTAAVDEVIQSAGDPAAAAARLVELVQGARVATEVLRELELEAARQARDHEVPLRALASATGMAERSAASRYRSPSVELAGTDDEPALVADQVILLPIIDLLQQAGLAGQPVLGSAPGRGPELHGIRLHAEEIDQVLELLAGARYSVTRL